RAASRHFAGGSRIPFALDLRPDRRGIPARGAGQSFLLSAVLRVKAANLSNLKPLLRIAAWLVLWAIVVNLALYALSATGLMSWLPDRQTGVGFAIDNR